MTGTHGKGHRVDALQYCNWTREIFEDWRAAGLDAVHVTIAYHETFSEMVARIEAWLARFRDHGDLVFQGLIGGDIRKARATGRTAVFFGTQNPAPLESDRARVEVCHRLGVRVMQLTYNLQSLCGAGWQEPVDSGLTLFGREVVAEMNRLGMIIDLSHAGARTTMDAIGASSRPVAVTHANPRTWRDTGRNVPDDVIRALGETGGMLGLSLYPHHLAGGSDCTLQAFCDMAARTAEMIGPGNLGIGSDLCQGQPDAVVQWMRDGRWTHARSDAVFPAQPTWFRTNRDWDDVESGLRNAGFSAAEAKGVMGENWLRFFDAGLQSQ
jgi:microsomal dipeptidase-like Zn-dependent dipeptidase